MHHMLLPHVVPSWHAVCDPHIDAMSPIHPQADKRFDSRTYIVSVILGGIDEFGDAVAQVGSSHHLQR
jgi:hypothetical protein